MESRKVLAGKLRVCAREEEKVVFVGWVYLGLLFLASG